MTPTQLTLTPNTTSIGGTVTVKCEPPSTGVRTLLGLVIFRVLHSNPNALRVEVVSAGPEQNNGNSSLIPGSSVTGTVDGSISQNFISLTMSQYSRRILADETVCTCCTFSGQQASGISLKQWHETWSFKFARSV